jgi:aminoglycoside phosphotransferase
MGRTRENPNARTPLPACMRSLVHGYEWTRDAIGASNAAVFRLQRPGSRSLIYA